MWKRSPPLTYRQRSLHRSGLWRQVPFACHGRFGSSTWRLDTTAATETPTATKNSCRGVTQTQSFRAVRWIKSVMFRSRFDPLQLQNKTSLHLQRARNASSPTCKFLNFIWGQKWKVEIRPVRKKNWEKQVWKSKNKGSPSLIYIPWIYLICFSSNKHKYLCIFGMALAHQKGMHKSEVEAMWWMVYNFFLQLKKNYCFYIHIRLIYSLSQSVSSFSSAHLLFIF